MLDSIEEVVEVDLIEPVRRKLSPFVALIVSKPEEKPGLFRPDNVTARCSGQLPTHSSYHAAIGHRCVCYPPTREEREALNVKGATWPCTCGAIAE